MAIKTDSLLSISANGVEYDKIGLSKTLNNYTFDELFDSVYCSADSNLIYHVASGGDMTYYDYQVIPSNGHIPVKLTPAGQNRSAIYFPNDSPMNMPDGLYFRVIWLQRTSSGFNSYIDKDGTGKFYKAITMLDPSHYVWECNPPTKQNNNYGANSWNAEDNLYCSESGALYYYDDIKSANPTRIVVNNVIPAIIFNFNEHNYILPYRQKMSYFFTKDNTHSESSYNPKTAKYCYDYDNSNPIAFPITTEQIYNHFNSSTGEFSSPFTEGGYISLGSSGYPSNGFSDTLKEYIMSIYSFGGNTSYDSYFGFSVYNYFKTKHECIKFWALCGLYIKADKIYKPLIKNGYVSDFTDDLNKKSDIDNWNGDTSHKVPNESPSKDSDDNNDSETDMEIGSGYSASGMVHYYKVTSENLQMLSKLMGNVDVVGTKDLLPNLISLKAFPIPFDRLGRGVVKTIEIGGVEMSDSIAGTAQGITVDSTYAFLSCCDTTIQGKYGNISSPHFLDFSPYTQVELILPLAGSVILPDNAMYKSLNVLYVYDIVNGTAICVVKSNGTVIATIPCTLSQDVPFSAINVGAKTSAMVSNLTNVAQNVATLGVSMGTGNVVGAISSGIGTVGSIAQSVMANNQNYMEKIGRTGDMCDFGLVKKAYIKYTRPVDIIPENFGRSKGYLCNVTKKLSDCKGFTVCENVDINVSATDTEKRIIKQLLETGIYI